MIRSDGALVSQYYYAPFGALLSSDNYGSVGGSMPTVDTVANTLRFAGREYDAETGLYLMRARYYDPSLGRFISEDPIGIAGGINSYLYASADPINRRDPTGLDDCSSTPPKPKDEIADVIMADVIPDCGGGGGNPGNPLILIASGDAPGWYGDAAANLRGGQGTGSGPKKERKSKLACFALGGATVLSGAADFTFVAAGWRLSVAGFRLLTTPTAATVAIRAGEGILGAEAALETYNLRLGWKQTVRTNAVEMGKAFAPGSAGRDALVALAENSGSLLADAMPVLGTIRLGKRAWKTCQSAFSHQ